MNRFPTTPVSRRQLLLAGGGLAAGLAVPTLAGAQSANAAWPNKPIKLTVGFSPGGVTDGLPRMYG
ncbi:MAG: tripartite tricarboxylate transporter substrate binding protein, partial [Rhodoferax sp.]|nr:tripartite tricarboxylate transporter substrate binding protein [Rhodoferax sp.]